MIDIKSVYDNGNEKQFSLWEDGKEIGCLTVLRRSFHIWFFIHISEDSLLCQNEWEKKLDKWMEEAMFYSFFVVVNGKERGRKQMESIMLHGNFKKMHFHLEDEPIENLEKYFSEETEMYVFKGTKGNGKLYHKNLKGILDDATKELQNKGYKIIGKLDKTGDYHFDCKSERYQDMLFFYDRGYHVKYKEEIYSFGERISKEEVLRFLEKEVKRIHDKTRLQELMEPKAETFFFDALERKSLRTHKVRKHLLEEMSVKELEEKSLKIIQENKRIKEMGNISMRIFQFDEYFIACSILGTSCITKNKKDIPGILEEKNAQKTNPLLDILANHIPGGGSRVITIEDTAEIQIRKK